MPATIVVCHADQILTKLTAIMLLSPETAAQKRQLKGPRQVIHAPDNTTTQCTESLGSSTA